MNVTNIGLPFAAPASQGGAADAAAAASGFAGLIGPAGAAEGMSVIAGSGQPGFGATPPPLLSANTTRPLLPGAADSATATMPADRPQVAMTQLLATAAPAAVTPPVVTGGNPLADAIAKALARRSAAVPAEGGASDTAPATVDAASKRADADPTLAPDAPVVAAPASGPALPAKTSAASSGAGAAGISHAAMAKPADGAGADPSLALNAQSTVEPQGDAPALPRQGAPAKGTAKSARAVLSDAPLAGAADLAAATLPQQPIAVPQAMAQAPSSPQAGSAPTPQTKNDAPAAIRNARADAAFATDGAPAPSTADKTADLASAVAGHGGGHHGDSGAPTDGGQQGFGQQLASADTRALSGQPLPAAFEVAKPVAFPAPAAAGEPVLHARPGELGRSLGVEIARTVDAGEDTLRVRLNPAELGRVEVTLAFDDKGRVQATMRAESHHTLELLRQDAPDLGRALDQAGIRNDAGSFRFESRDSGTGSTAGGQPGFQQQQSRSGNQRFQEEPELPATAYRSVRSDGQVDLIA